MKNTIPFLGLLSLSLLTVGCATNNQPAPAGHSNLGMGVPNAQTPNANQSAQYSSMSHLPLTNNPAQQPNLTNVLTSQLGVNQKQAMGGIGSIFALAQQRMTPADFAQISNAVPGMNGYLSAVPNNSGLLGSAAAVAGQNSPLGSLASLAGAFQLLGMNSNMIGQFLPLMLQYVQQQGGASTMNLLQNALR